MAEQGRIAPRLRLCRGCRQFVGWEAPDCRFCGGDLDEMEAEHEARQQAVRDAAAALQAAIEAERP
ncbi:MAG TPA: hypothetical protein VF535_04560 [Allosphingosinicella sp.]|jgi:hypothetical protein